MSGTAVGGEPAVQLTAVPALWIESWNSAYSRITELLSDRRGREQWWAELANQLDVLAAGLSDFVADRGQPNESVDSHPSEESRTHGWLRRLDGEWEHLILQTASVRSLVSRYAGDSMAVGAVAGSVRELMMLLMRLQERSTELLLRGAKVPAQRSRP